MMDGKSFLYEFGPYHLNARERVLIRGGSPVGLTPKAFATLLILVQNSGHVIPRDELMQEVWPDAYVEEANLTQNIFTLRRVLGKSSDNSEYIETVSRRGYRFVAPVREVSDVASAAGPTTESGQVNGQGSNVQLDRVTRFLAVLPFVNASADVKMEYLSDGITESIINSLSQLPRLRVMSRSAVFRYKGRELDAQRIGVELGVDTVLVGRVNSLEGRLLVSTELVAVGSGWQLWGENYDRGQGAIFEVQDEIARQISATLRLRLTGDEEQRLTRRYTESAEAYQAYLRGRYYWGKYTRAGIEGAIGCFRQAINLDPDYALAYAGIVDCYLRLATNYIPPADVLPQTRPAPALETDHKLPADDASLKMVQIRHEWDRKSAERESKRAVELKSTYPTAHHWYAAYLFSMSLYNEVLGKEQAARTLDTAAADPRSDSTIGSALLTRVQSAEPAESEQVQVFCTIAREQIDAGNYEAAVAVLQRWWTLGERPRLEGLSLHSSADLFLTCGAITGWVASARQVAMGQKHAEELLNGSIAFFEQLGLKTRSAEGRIELACCYYREGFFDLARTALVDALEALPEEDLELRSLALIRLAIVERHAARLLDSLGRLNEAAGIVELAGPWATGRYYLELATTLKELAISESRDDYFGRAIQHYAEALHEFEAIGNHRYAAIIENNHGYLLLTLKRLDEAEIHLARARKLLHAFTDKVRGAQVDETLAQLHVAAGRIDLAEQESLRAVKALEAGGEDALLAEALSTQGLVLCRVGRHREAKRVLERAYRVAEHCGDGEGAGRALLIVIEEMCDQLEEDERLEAGVKLDQLLAHSQQASVRERLQKCTRLIADANRPLTLEHE